MASRSPARARRNSTSDIRENKKPSSPTGTRANQAPAVPPALAASRPLTPEYNHTPVPLTEDETVRAYLHSAFSGRLRKDFRQAPRDAAHTLSALADTGVCLLVSINVVLNASIARQRALVKRSAAESLEKIGSSLRGARSATQQSRRLNWTPARPSTMAKP